MKKSIFFIFCLLAIKTIAQSNDTLIKGFSVSKILPSKDKITIYEEHLNLRNGDTYQKPNYFIQSENEYGEVLYKKPIDFVYNILQLSSIDFVNTQKGILFFSSLWYGTSITAYSTIDGGTTWKQSNVGGSGGTSPFEIVRINEDVVLVYFKKRFHDNQNSFYITRDGGMNWERKIINPNSKEKVIFSIMKVDFDKKGKIIVLCTYKNQIGKEIGTQKFISKDFGKTFK